mgnify:CR=1 FL=1
MKRDRKILELDIRTAIEPTDSLVIATPTGTYQATVAQLLAMVAPQGSGGIVTTTNIANAAHTIAAAGELCRCSGVCAITIAAACEQDGAQVWVKLGNATSVTLQTESGSLMDGASLISIDSPYSTIPLRYAAAAGAWDILL